MSDIEIFSAAVKLPPDRRQEYLDQACGANHELRREVESPDGRHVLAALFETVGDSDGATAVPVRIAAISVADGSIRVLKSLTAEKSDLPRLLLSPDGRYVIARSDFGAGVDGVQIYLVDVTTWEA